MTTPATKTQDIGDSRDIAEGEPATSHSMSVTRETDEEDRDVADERLFNFNICS